MNLKRLENIDVRILLLKKYALHYLFSKQSVVIGIQTMKIHTVQIPNECF